MMKHKSFVTIILLLFSFTCLVVFESCYKKREPNWSGPYEDAPKSPIKFSNDKPSPIAAREGDVVTLKMIGLDSLAKIDQSLLRFYVNGVSADLVKISPADGSVTITVPVNASTGAVTLKVGDKTFFGPNLGIRGNLWIDSSFTTGGTDLNGDKILGGANREIYDLFYDSFFGDLYVAGAFTTWNDSSYYDGLNGKNTASNLIIVSPATGNISAERFSKGTGPNGPINGILKLPSSNILIPYGSYSRWDGWDGVNNMTRIFTNGELNYVSRVVANDDPTSTRNIDTIPIFLGGTESGRPPLKVFLNRAGRLVSVGNFTTHKFNLVDYATFSFIPSRSSIVPQFMAQDLLGRLDSSFGYISSSSYTYPQNFKPLNGTILDAIQLSSFGKIIVAGNFNGGLVMLEDDGKVSTSFTASTNGPVTKITYNPVTRKILICGTFTSVNGTSTPSGLAMLLEDGTIDPTFALGQIELSSENIGQIVTYAGQLNNGNVVIAGNFGSYKSTTSTVAVTRPGFMMLNDAGELAPNLNNTGVFKGQINDIQEYLISTGKPSLIIAGSISVFDGVPVKNIVRVGMYAR